MKTADIKILRIKPELFVWGEIVKIHSINCYAVIEYIDYENKTYFKPYFDDKEDNCSYPDFDSALLKAMFNKNKSKHFSAARALLTT